MKLLIATIITIFGSTLSHGGIIDNINKTIEMQGKALDQINDILDGKKNLLPVVDFNKNCTIEKNQLISLRKTIQRERNNHNKLSHAINKERKRNNKNYHAMQERLLKQVKALKEENAKLKKLLKINNIDYKHANIVIHKPQKTKKLKITITDK